MNRFNKMYLGVILSFTLMISVIAVVGHYELQQLNTKANPTLEFKFPAYTGYNDGQGIYYIAVYDNSSGSFLLVRNITAGMDEGATVNVSCSVYLVIGVAINKTLLNWGANNLGAWSRFNVSLTVTVDNGTQIYSASNLTYGGFYGEIAHPIYLANVNNTLNFVTEEGFRYFVALDLDTAW